MSSASATSQSENEDVHIEPRQYDRQRVVPNASTTPQIVTIRRNVDLVLVPVTVTDESNRLIVGLDKSNFQLYDSKQTQKIKYFSKEDIPVSIGIVLDLSGSMETKLGRARESINALLRESNPEDEFFLMTFADRPMLLQNFTQSPSLAIHARQRTHLFAGCDCLEYANNEEGTLFEKSFGNHFGWRRQP